MPVPARTIRITEVSPRDGLQNEAGVIPTSDKIRLVTALLRCRFDEIEVSSFVSPRWVPQLGDAAEVFAGVAATGGRPRGLLSALVPNEKGLEAALEVNRAAGGNLIGKVSVFTAASETFARRNTNASITETLERFRPVVARAHDAGLLVRGYVSCVIACPFEGIIDPVKVAGVGGRLRELGVDELDLGDTIGVGTAEATAAMLGAVATVWPLTERVTLHLHDTFGRAAECVAAALSMGVGSFDGSVAGLGGCPYAGTPGRPAPGNIATELLVRTIQREGYTTAVDLDALAGAASLARELVARARAGAGS